MFRSRPPFAPLVLAGAVLATACTFGAPPPSRADLAGQSACRERADQVFERQNRDQAFRVDTYQTDTRDAPLSTNGLKGVTSAGLPEQYGRDTMVDNCLRSSGAGQQPPMSRDLHSNGPASP